MVSASIPLPVALFSGLGTVAVDRASSTRTLQNAFMRSEVMSLLRGTTGSGKPLFPPRHAIKRTDRMQRQRRRRNRCREIGFSSVFAVVCPEKAELAPICPASHSTLGHLDLGTGTPHAQHLAGQFAPAPPGLGEVRLDLLGGHAPRF